MKNLLFTFCVLSLAGCVSAKKYQLLEADYQKAGAAQRGYEQEQRILLVELQDLKQKVAKLEAKNQELDSTNHALRRKILLDASQEDWQAKYEALLQAYDKLAPADKARGDEPKESPENKTDKGAKRVPPPITHKNKAYRQENPREVKIPDAPKKETETPKQEDIAKKEPQPVEKNAGKEGIDKEPAAKQEPQPIDKNAGKQESKPETEKARAGVSELNNSLQTVLKSYQMGENIKQSPQQITIAFSDEVLFAEGDASKFSPVGEELLRKLVATFSQYPNLTIDLVSEGAQSDEKTKKIGELFAQSRIRTRILPKNDIPLAFETSGTQKSVSFLTLRME